MRGSVPAMPMAFQADLFASVDHGDDDPLQQEPDDRLALLLGRRLGSPEGGQIVGQILDGGYLGRRGRFGPLAREAFVLRRKTGLLAQGRLPDLLQAAGHQPVFGLDAGVPAAGLVDLILRLFQPLAPMTINRGALALQISDRRQLVSIAAGSSAFRIRRATCVSTGSAFNVWQNGSS